MMILSGAAMVMTIAGAIIAVGQKNIVRAVLGLAISLGGVALAFLALNSPFVAAMEVLIYIGGTTVAMIFAVMLSSTGQHEPGDGRLRQTLAAIAAILFFLAVAIVIHNAEFGATPATSEDAWSVRQIGLYLLNEFNVVFELLSVVLLLAIVGAITIAGRHGETLDPTAHEEDEA